MLRALAAFVFCLFATASLSSAQQSQFEPSGNPQIWDDVPGTRTVLASTSPSSTDGTAIAYVASRLAPCSGQHQTGPAGQTFFPGVAAIERMDFRVQVGINSDLDLRPIRISIYEWDTQNEQPTGPVLYQTTHSLVETGGGNALVSIRPNNTFDTAKTYYVEFTVPADSGGAPLRSDYTVASRIPDPEDPNQQHYYTGGKAFDGCSLLDDTDFWFEFYTAEVDPAPDRPLEGTAPTHFEDPVAARIPPADFRAQIRARLEHVYQEGYNGDYGLPASAFFYLQCRDHNDCIEDLTDIEDRLNQGFVDAVALFQSNQQQGKNPNILNFSNTIFAFALMAREGVVDGQDPVPNIQQAFFFPTLGYELSISFSAPANQSFVAASQYMLYDVAFGDAHDHFTEYLDPSGTRTDYYWRDFYQDIWTNFWNVRETEEDSDNYNAISWSRIQLMAHFAQDVPSHSTWYSDVWGDPPFEQLVERWYELVTPVGAIATYGDTGGVNARTVGALIWLFVKASEELDDPKYLEAAHRLFAYHETRQRNWPTPEPVEGEPEPSPHEEMTAQTNGQIGLIMAYWAFDELPSPPSATAPPSVPDDPGSVYTLRRYMERQITGAVGTDPRLWGGDPPAPPGDVPSLVANTPFTYSGAFDPALTPYIPSKLILRSPGGKDGLTYIFNLLHGYGHDQSELGAMVFNSDDDSILALNGPHPYGAYRRVVDQRAKMSSGPLLQKYQGGTPVWENRGDHVTLPRFQDGAEATVAWAEFEPGDLNGYGLNQRRHFVFAKNAFLLVRDGFEAGPDSMHVSLGPVWHAVDVADKPMGADPNWFDFFHQSPLSNVSRYRNPDRHSLLYFLDRPDTVVDGYKDWEYLTVDPASPPGSPALHPDCPSLDEPLTVKTGTLECRNAAPYVMYQRWTGQLTPTPSGGDEASERWFDSLLIPHNEIAQDVAARVTPLDIGDDYAALRVEMEDGRRFTVVDNPNGHSVCGWKVGQDCWVPLTNATSLVYRTGGPAQNDYLLASDADFFFESNYTASFNGPTNIEGPVKTLTFGQTSASHDGLVLGSGISGSGAGASSAGQTLVVGDGFGTLQIQSVLSFDSSAIPDGATIVDAHVKLTRASITGDPFGGLGGPNDEMFADVVPGFFGAGVELAPDDFIGVVSPDATVTDNGTNAFVFLGSEANGLVNKSGVTQFRLRFPVPENGGVADNVQYYAEEASAELRPVLTVHYVPPACGGTCGSALFVAGSDPHSASDAVFITSLEALGFSVEVVEDADITTAHADGHSLIVVSSTVKSSDVGDKFTDVAIPLITWESYLYDDLEMTGSVQGTDYGVASSQTQIDVIPGLALSGSLAGGATTVTAQPQKVFWGVPSAAAQIAATHGSSGTQAAIFGYEAGDTMVGLDAPARRVGFFLGDDAGLSWTMEAQELFEEAVVWAAGGP